MRSIIITGASGGIGVETIKALSQPDTTLVCVDINESGLDQLQVMASGYDCELQLVRSALETKEECLKVVENAPGELTGFVHLAGVFEPDVNTADNMAVYDRAIQHNLTNAYMLSFAVAEAIGADGRASFVYASSLAFRRGAKDYIAYSAAKGGLVGITRALSRHLAPRIRVNSVAPGLINTSMPAPIIAARGDSITDEVPLKRLGEASEVASVIAFLLSDGASYITGQTINVDGGIIHG